MIFNVQELFTPFGIDQFFLFVDNISDCDRIIHPQLPKAKIKDELKESPRTLWRNQIKSIIAYRDWFFID